MSSQRHPLLTPLFVPHPWILHNSKSNILCSRFQIVHPTVALKIILLRGGAHVELFVTSGIYCKWYEQKIKPYYGLVLSMWSTPPLKRPTKTQAFILTTKNKLEKYWDIGFSDFVHRPDFS
jgi:hypothetical protein